MADLVHDVEMEEQSGKEETAKALRLDGKYARSHAEVEEQERAKEAKVEKQRRFWIDTKNENSSVCKYSRDC